MRSNYSIRTVTDDDKDAVLSIFNYYIENSFAAYRENKVDSDFFQQFKKMASGYPFYVVEIPGDRIIGFAFLHGYSTEPCFNRAAEITYFILPSYTGKGIGRDLLDMLISDSRKIGIETLLAHISSKNQRSIDFHKQNGFEECGRFVNIGKKFGEDFDVVWMQKFLQI